MQRSDLTATAAVGNLVVCGLAIAAGVALIYRSLAEWIGDRMDGDLTLALAAAGVALVLAGMQGRRIHHLKVSAASTLEALHDLLYGKDHRRDREAISILLASLCSDDAGVRDSAYAHLRRLTGQEFAADAAVWEAWWKAHERSWSRRTARPATEDHTGDEAG